MDEKTAMTIRKAASFLLMLATVALAFLWITGRVPPATGLLDRWFRPQPHSIGFELIHWPSASEATTILAHGSFRAVAGLLVGFFFQLAFNLWFLKLLFVSSLIVGEEPRQRDTTAVEST